MSTVEARDISHGADAVSPTIVRGKSIDERSTRWYARLLTDAPRDVRHTTGPRVALRSMRPPLRYSAVVGAARLGFASRATHYAQHHAIAAPCMNGIPLCSHRACAAQINRSSTFQSTVSDIWPHLPPTPLLHRQPSTFLRITFGSASSPTNDLSRTNRSSRSIAKDRFKT